MHSLSACQGLQGFAMGAIARALRSSVRPPSGRTCGRPKPWTKFVMGRRTGVPIVNRGDVAIDTTVDGKGST
jgi:hypothetical protein